MTGETSRAPGVTVPHEALNLRGSAVASVTPRHKAPAPLAFKTGMQYCLYYLGAEAGTLDVVFPQELVI